MLERNGMTRISRAGRRHAKPVLEAFAAGGGVALRRSLSFSLCRSDNPLIFDFLLLNPTITNGLNLVSKQDFC
jgi:hypothetical protein